MFTQISGTVEDPTVYKDIKITLQRIGYARTAPDPQWDSQSPLVIHLYNSNLQILVNCNIGYVYINNVGTGTHRWWVYLLTR